MAKKKSPRRGRPRPAQRASTDPSAQDAPRAAEGPARYRAELKPAAARQLRDLDGETGRRIARAIDGLTRNPRPSGARPLRGTDEDFLRVRVGDHRIIYQIRDEILTVLIVRIGDRRDIYRNLKDL